MENLTQHSIDVILQNQAASGAYIASPNFPNYRFCWFRDGSFTAYSMDLIGEHSSAVRFHEWAANAINRHANVVHRAINRIQANEPLADSDYLHTRYTLDGDDATPNEWPDFQLDGFGTWLWALGEHLNLTQEPPPETWICAAGLVADYLTALWQHPCYDCWEENADMVHPYTLAAIFGGLKAHSQFTTFEHQESMQSIVAFVRKLRVTKGHFVKFFGSSMVDASLLGLTTPYRLVEPNDPFMLTTVSHLEQSLMCGGGVHRYPTDSYYGGGEWVLLTGWLGWYYIDLGKYDQAKALLRWMEMQADIHGNLPEQVPANLNSPSNYEPWVKRWGQIATPLLWSHAMYLILHHNLSL
jgi:GH15 family glucan-1,4-alpha-glucosidase